MTKRSIAGRHADRILSEPRPLGSGTGSVTHDRFLTGAARFSKWERGVRSAFSMVEAAFCVVLVGGLLVVSLDTLGASKMAQRNLGERALGQLLASSLMSEILTLSYEDPNETPVAGLELSENSLLRTTYDDVDDYINWTASPPQNRDGTTIPGLTGWAQSVQIAVVDLSDLSVKRISDTGVKRITVTITRNSVVVASLVGVKTGTPNPLLSF